MREDCIPYEDHLRIVKNLIREHREKERDYSENYRRRYENCKRLMRTWDHCFISDIHVGSIYFDVLSFNKILERLKNEKIKCGQLHIAGDIVEGKLNHRGQGYESFPLEIQEALAVDTIKKIIEVLKPVVTHILPGNHDRKWGINLLDNVINRLRDEIETEIKYYRDDEEYVVDDILVMHGIGRTGGSDYTGLTPLIMNNIIAKVRDYDVDIVVLGHYHRPVVLNYLNILIIELPSFQYADRPLRNERGLLLLRNKDEFRLIREKTARRKELLEYWRNAVKV